MSQITKRYSSIGKSLFIELKDLGFKSCGKHYMDFNSNEVCMDGHHMVINILLTLGNLKKTSIDACKRVKTMDGHGN